MWIHRAFPTLRNLRGSSAVLKQIQNQCRQQALEHGELDNLADNDFEGLWNSKDAKALNKGDKDLIQDICTH